MERGAEALEEQRSPLDVVAEQRHASPGCRAAERHDLAPGGIAVAGYDDLHDGRPSVPKDCRGDVRLRRILEGAADGDLLRALQRRDESGQLFEPSTSAHGERLPPDDGGDLEHGGASGGRGYAATGQG